MSLQYDSPSADDLEELTECYVIAVDKSWTYILTHEDGILGPYFYRLPKKRKLHYKKTPRSGVFRFGVLTFRLIPLRSGFRWRTG